LDLFAKYQWGKIDLSIMCSRNKSDEIHILDVKDLVDQSTERFDGMTEKNKGD